MASKRKIRGKPKSSLKPKRKLKKRHYLDALLSPNLGPDRRYALTLMAKVEIIKSQNKTAKTTINSQDVDALALSFKCVNCFKKTYAPKLYCGVYCQRFGAMVRYIRKCVDMDKIQKRDIQEGIGINLLMLASGGYPTQERKVSKETREEVFKRDGYTCARCGRPATQIDHIKGNSSQVSNLSALCADCNRKKAFENTSPARGKQLEAIEEMLIGMATRVAATKPLQICDDYERWNTLQGRMMGARKRRFNELEEELENDFEDVDGYLRDAMEKDD